MSTPVHPAHLAEPPEGLEQEVLRLEAELQRAEATLNAFEQAVRAQLGEQIRQIRVLTAVYKARKAAKKEKRREQKRRGKNYKEPQGLLRPQETREDDAPVGDGPAELKRLYREAIVQVHPDKFPEASEAEGRQAAALTTHLNALYERGDLEALRDFHEHILGEQPLRHTPYAVAGNATRNFLLHKKEQLAAALEALLQSQSYQLAVEPDRGKLMDELREQFVQRIAQLTKRTRQ
ncbi:J domain-containing protein [Dawidia soli]|uniref:J domain-containing protein n=1 Tax=Dawidia soli TaxID=2782352 RepID=A0AAP2D9G2_9BACT|nr:J domain-containing protein [Dawidia soli]MBT1685062.1 J domain-containing protein [Dawidia soli]